jgi:predicted acetyltransferase
MPSVTILPISKAEAPRLWTMLQTYLGELSRLGGDGPVNGVFPYQYFDAYWIEAVRWPFWIEADGEIAGFALVRRCDHGVYDMSEFYIVPEYRRGGIGLDAARAIFARFPGGWTLSQFKENEPAIRFWRHVLEGFAPYDETRGERIEQRFESRLK